MTDHRDGRDPTPVMNGQDHPAVDSEEPILAANSDDATSTTDCMPATISAMNGGDTPLVTAPVPAAAVTAESQDHNDEHTHQGKTTGPQGIQRRTPFQAESDLNENLSKCSWPHANWPLRARTLAGLFSCKTWMNVLNS